MGLLTFSINVTLDGCVDHEEGIADDETHAFFTRLMDESGAMLWGRVTYEMMESYWPAVARGDVPAPPAMREWAVKLEAKPKYVVSSTRKDFPWTNSHHLAGGIPTQHPWRRLDDLLWFAHFGIYGIDGDGTNSNQQVLSRRCGLRQFDILQGLWIVDRQVAVKSDGFHEASLMMATR